MLGKENRNIILNPLVHLMLREHTFGGQLERVGWDLETEEYYKDGKWIDPRVVLGDFLGREFPMESLVHSLWNPWGIP